MFGFFKNKIGKTNVGRGYTFNKVYDEKVGELLDKLNEDMFKDIEDRLYLIRNSLDTISITKKTKPENKIVFFVPEQDYTFIGCGSLYDEFIYKFVPSIDNARRLVNIKNKLLDDLENNRNEFEEKKKKEFLDKMFSFDVKDRWL